MKLSGNKIQVEFTPLRVSGSLSVAGGALVQFFDGTSYSPDREGIPSSPILLTHTVSAFDPDNNSEVNLEATTTFYENDVVISGSTEGYELMGNELLVKKNVSPASSIVIRAVSEFIDTRNNKVYQREDSVTLRTLLKAEAQYNIELSLSGVVYFDGYRNPNTLQTIEATLKQGEDEVSDLTGIELRWLNKAGLDAEANELYVDSISPDGKTIVIDKTYIDNEHIVIEAWRDGAMIATNSVTFVRRFNSFRTEIKIPEIPIVQGTATLNLSIEITDILGNVDVDEAFLVNWIISENGVEREIATGASVKIPVASINLSASNLQTYPDVKRREAFAAITVDDAGEEALLTDDEDNILTTETYGA